METDIYKLNEDNAYLQRVLKSQDETITKQQQSLVEARIQIEFLEKQLVNCQKNFEITKQNMVNALTDQNRVQNEYGEEIRQLKDKIKELKQDNEQ